MAKKENEKVEDALFTKENLISSKKYKDNRDLLWALLEDGKKYSFEQTDKLIKDFLKGEVK